MLHLCLKAADNVSVQEPQAGESPLKSPFLFYLRVLLIRQGPLGGQSAFPSLLIQMEVSSRSSHTDSPG